MPGLEPATVERTPVRTMSEMPLRVSFLLVVLLLLDSVVGAFTAGERSCAEARVCPETTVLDRLLRRGIQRICLSSDRLESGRKCSVVNHCRLSDFTCQGHCVIILWAD